MATNSPSTLPPLPPNVAAIVGPRLVGYLLHYGLFGILCVQVYLFHLAFPKDPLRNKIMVYVVFCLELAQTLILSNTAWNVFAKGYGNLEVFNEIEEAWFDVPVITGVVAFIAQVFYAYRLSILAQSNWVAILVVVLATVQLGGGIAVSVVVKRAGSFADLLGRDYTITATLWNGVSALCDIIIAVSMTYYLSRRRSGGMKNTNVLIKKVITLVIETGTVTAVVAALNLILATLPGGPTYYLATCEIIAKIYSNSMMVVLNSRMRIGVDSSASSDGSNIMTAVGRPRGGVNTMSTLADSTDTYQMGGGVKVTQEEIVFPSDARNKGGFNTDKGYLA